MTPAVGFCSVAEGQGGDGDHPAAGFRVHAVQHLLLVAVQRGGFGGLGKDVHGGLERVGGGLS